MAGLLIHSMAEFSDIILTSIEIADARDIVEIGAESGTMTRRLIEYAEARKGKFTSVDSNPDSGLQQMFRNRGHAELVKSRSIEALSTFLLPYQMNPLLERLERNRLECYLRVIAWQDGDEKRPA